MKKILYINLLFILGTSLFIIFDNKEINRDGVLYLTQAKYFFDADFNQALSIYDWPFYGFLIAVLSKYINISLENSAYTINLFLFLILALFFIRTVNYITKDKLSFTASSIILLTSIPLLDDYLVMIIRDHGQWACCMFSIYYLIKWTDKPTYKYSFLYQLGFLLATFFRPESLYILIGVLIYFIFRNIDNNFKLRINTILKPFIFFIFIFLLSYFLFNNHLSSLGKLDQAPNILSSIIENLKNGLIVNSNNDLFNILIDDYHSSFIYIFLTYVFIFKWFTGLGVFHFALFLVSNKYKTVSQKYTKVLYLLIFLSLVGCYLNLLNTNVISSRYFVLSWLIIYLFSATGLIKVFYVLKNKNSLKNQIYKVILYISIFILYLFIVIDTAEKHIELEAAEWLKSRSIKNDEIIFNNARAAYYFGIYQNKINEIPENYNNEKYISYTLKQKQLAPNFTNYSEMMSFSSKKNSTVIIIFENNLK